MMLTGLEIKQRIKKGDIVITPFDETKVNPNSVNLKLHNELLVYTDKVLDMKKPLNTKKIIIPEEGLVLEPGVLYLGRTYERTITKGLVPVIDGRSSIGRLGIFIHVTAGFGDIGFDGFWTLEITVIHPVRIYPMVDIGQIRYHTIEGEYLEYGKTKNKSGKYQIQDDIMPSMIHKDFENNEDK